MTGFLSDPTKSRTNPENALRNGQKSTLLNKKRPSPRISSGMMVNHPLRQGKPKTPITLAKVWKD